MAAREVYWAFGQPSNKSVCVTRWQDATDGDWTKRFFSGDRINKTQITADNSIEKGRNEHVYLICSRFATVQRIYLVTFFQFQAFFHARNALFGSIRCSIFQIDPLASHLWWVGQILGLPDLFFWWCSKKEHPTLGLHQCDPSPKNGVLWLFDEISCFFVTPHSSPHAGWLIQFAALLSGDVIFWGLTKSVSYLGYIYITIV